MPDAYEVHSSRAADIFFNFDLNPWWERREITMTMNSSASGSFKAYCSPVRGAVDASLSMDHLAKTFSSLARKWEKETRNVSSLDKMAEHPAYRAIVSLGYRVLPFVLARLQQSAAYWFPVLVEITGVNPVDPTDRGDFLAMQRAWLNWANRNADR